MTRKAYAKINLGLRILRKRDDGYHDIDTVFHRVDLYDEIYLEPSSTIKVFSNESNLPTDEGNLCIRAAQLLREYSGIEKGVNISLTKNIPIGAGLGGGSSDAAATLIGLTKLWEIDVPQNDMHKLALQLGSDVPYFLKYGTAHATGRGEILDYFDINIPHWIVIVYPNIHISTSWAYGEIHNSQFSPAAGGQATHHSHPYIESLKQILLGNIDNPQKLNFLLHNDFEPVVLHKYQSIAFAKLTLYTEGASFAQMSGSGSAIYGFFSNEESVSRASEKLSKQYKVFITPPNFKP